MYALPDELGRMVNAIVDPFYDQLDTNYDNYGTNVRCLRNKAASDISRVWDGFDINQTHPNYRQDRESCLKRIDVINNNLKNGIAATKYLYKILNSLILLECEIQLLAMIRSYFHITPNSNQIGINMCFEAVAQEKPCLYESNYDEIAVYVDKMQNVVNLQTKYDEEVNPFINEFVGQFKLIVIKLGDEFNYYYE